MAPRKTLNDVIEQLKVNNETTVDIDKGIAGLENQFGKFFADLKRQKLEESREAKADKQTAGIAPLQTSDSSSSSGGRGLFGSLKGLKGIGAVLAAVLPFAAKNIGIGIGAAGVGIAAFFTGLAGAEAIIRNFVGQDAGKGLKELLINLSEGLGAFSKKSFVALGTVLAAGIIFPGKTTKGLGAVGIGLGAFLLGLAGSDKLMQMMDGDQGANLKALLVNFAAGLEAFDIKTFTMLGTLLGAGAIFGVTGLAGPAAIGIGAIGVGIGAFLVALGGITKLGSVLGVDGSAFKVLIGNIAAGLKELADVPTEGLLKKVGAIGLIGPAVLAAITSFTAAQGVDALINGAKKVINFVTFGKAGLQDQATARKGMIRDLVDAMKPLQEIPSDLGNQLDTLATSLTKFMLSFNKIAANLNVEKFGETFLVLGETLAMTRNLIYAMANGGEFKKPGILNKIAGIFGGGKIDFGPEGEGGLLSPTLKTDDLVKQVEKINFVLGKTNIAPVIEKPISPTNYPDRIQNMTGGSVNNSGNVQNSGNTNTTNVGNQIVTTDGVSDKKMFDASMAAGVL